MEKLNDKEALLAFGRNLRKLRTDKGLTLVALSIDSRIDTSDIGKIERGEINLAYTTLLKLAIGLRESPIKLVEFSE